MEIPGPVQQSTYVILQKMTPTGTCGSRAEVLIEQNAIVLMLCVQCQEIECVKLRSAIIRKILAEKEKFCSQVEMQEYFLRCFQLSSKCE